MSKARDQNFLFFGPPVRAWINIRQLHRIASRLLHDPAASAAARLALENAKDRGLNYPVQFYDFIYEPVRPLKRQLSVLKGSVNEERIANFFSMI